MFSGFFRFFLDDRLGDWLWLVGFGSFGGYFSVLVGGCHCVLTCFCWFSGVWCWVTLVFLAFLLCWFFYGFLFLIIFKLPWWCCSGFSVSCLVLWMLFGG